MLTQNGSKFEREVASLLNEHSLENDSNTPDYILAQYLTRCLANYNDTVILKEKWNGRSIEEARLVTHEP